MTDSEVLDYRNFSREKVLLCCETVSNDRFIIRQIALRNGDRSDQIYGRNNFKAADAERDSRFYKLGNEKSAELSIKVMKNKNFSGGLFASGKPQPLTIKETPLSAQIKEYLDNRRLWNERLNCGKVRTASGNWITLCEKGTPDRITLVCGDRRFYRNQNARAAAVRRSA